MTWPQYLDDRRRLARLFDVQKIPTYVLLDEEGIERLRVAGTGLQDARNLTDEIDRQIKRLATPKPDVR
jgi:hypothetical protein